jgi:hypothetical protein
MLADLTPAQRKLAAYMSELSERAYYAGWMEGLEYALWRAVTVGPFQYGHLTLTAEHTQRLKALSEACGGWIKFDEDTEESFVPTARWLEQYQET